MLAIAELDKIIVELIHGLGALRDPGSKLVAMKQVIYYLGLLVHHYGLDPDIRQEYELDVLRPYKSIRDADGIHSTHEALLALLRRLHEHLKYKSRAA